jgi:CheY-like chemotaxis protein
MAKILVIDDDSAVAEAILNVVRSAGHEGAGESTLQRGLNRLQEDPFDLVFLDVNLPDGSGLDTLPQIQSAASSPEVIIVTGFGDPDGAELAIKNGAWDYLSKPLSVLSIRLPLERALLYREKKMGARPLMAVSREGIIGESPRLKPCFDSLAQAAASEANVLITGETGTGKELFAWAIHRNGARRDRNFVVVDCAALPETLVESTLFGQLKGAFTGADKPRDGLIKQANGGTLFLDEVGELPISLQKVFLRVLQEKRFRPVGGGPEVASDFRLVAATNRDLATRRGGAIQRGPPASPEDPGARDPAPERAPRGHQGARDRLCRPAVRSIQDRHEGVFPGFLGGPPPIRLARERQGTHSSPGEVHSCCPGRAHPLLQASSCPYPRQGHPVASRRDGSRALPGVLIIEPDRAAPDPVDGSGYSRSEDRRGIPAATRPDGSGGHGRRGPDIGLVDFAPIRTPEKISHSRPRPVRLGPSPNSAFFALARFLK